MMADAKITIRFTKTKETKGTHVFTEEGDTPSVGTLYLKKSAAATLGNPETLIVTIESA